MFLVRGILRKRVFRRIFFAVIFILTLTLLLQVTTKQNVRNLLELDKCPACYGVSLCSDILQGSSEISIVFDFWGRLGLLANALATKNVFSGSLGHQRVIVKRLGDNSELQQMDKNICHTMGINANCGIKMKEVVFRISNLRETVQKLINQSSNINEYRLRLCPSIEHADGLFSPILPKVNGSKPGLLTNDGFTANVWTMLLINPEPLLLQILRAEDGWPVPRYVGACGRIVVTLNAGEPLLDHFDKSWPERAGLALQLLLAADRFTYSHPQFAFYLLDISADNIVVNNEGKLSFVDLEHTLIVDRHPSSLPDVWNESHVSDSYDDCPGCNMFSSDSICHYHTSDHNHYMICQQLLAPGMGSSDNFMPGGLLHSAPILIQKNYPQLETFLLECASGKSTDRIRSARRLRDVLTIVSKESPLFGEQSLTQTWKYF
ncbi:hypothetical protein ONE63_005840 [Megalurothrips usitatus]|uniref:FAM69 protein-kinase domain-containing protein n=1 Tax=Megalurothrips usitatus TaxID=439358 RepID=A0AAV7XWU0_9NEOP|nr:hypothetical protein ONE63_005840 [Megalurothrips usitatus]